MQAPVTVSVQAPEGHDDRRVLLGLTREHFGATAKITPRESFGRLADDIRQDDSTIGVASARFEGEREGAWWTACMSSDETAPRVISALPFHGETIAGYCICRAPLEESGNDETLVAVQLDDVLSRSGVSSALKRAKIDGSHLTTSGTTSLLRVVGFHAASDAPMLSTIANAFGVSVNRIAVVGAYPTPIRETEETSA